MNIKSFENSLCFKGNFLCTDILNQSINKANRREIVRFSNILERIKKAQDTKRYVLIEKKDEFINESQSRNFILKEMSEDKDICLFRLSCNTKSIYTKILNTVNNNLKKFYPKNRNINDSTQEYQNRIKQNLEYDKPKNYFND